MHLAFLFMLLAHLHLTALEPAIREGAMLARNPVVRKDVKAAVKVVSAYEKNRNRRKSK
jgi:hypothetical protein